ncbi:LuxR C-terminal-related transcriptional regulator [Streptomyces sp900116325]|uniref:LuxR C-terminal-related transcriptional regulator n=1 Tax=Streptomyces sp. 900116325 TaxID=3154295 RepID=UPI003321A9D1
MGRNDTIGSPLLRQRDLDTYRAVAAGHDALATDAIAGLVDLHLVDPDPYRPGAFIARDPRAVAQDLMATALADLTATIGRIGQIPAVEALAADYDPHRFYGGPGSEYLGTPALMNSRIGPLTDAATTEVYSAQPGEPVDRDPEILRIGTERTVTACRRGVQVRSLYNARAHEHDQTRACIDDLVAAGADVRVLGKAFPRMVLLDRQHLFIDNLVVAGAAPHSGWHVSDRSAVMWARSIFDLYWDRATPWPALARAAGSAVTSARQREILHELEAGYSQQQAARRLGLAERTVTKELAELRSELRARTLYQVMAWWGRSTERQLP